ncbi:hypothetical protein N617_gp27 [Stygiolobus rod-shaped virus]|uniref:Uncharacterized protein n=1 Tax=Stygiolobus rod-shaped virus TaxID=537009 RepID=B6EFD3_9VIRU|nr:hypothetical protein N617_gp27 [Stygiolobus rod-shaped virus]CAQ58468.1 hypothetical protein [Stygiolobus rod-shaped virus]
MSVIIPAGVETCAGASNSVCCPNTSWVFATYNLTRKVTIKLVFSQSVNISVVLSKYPFNFGYGGNFCINQDSQIYYYSGQTIEFDVDLSQYYMLVAVDVSSYTLTECLTYVSPNGQPLELIIYVNGVQQTTKQSTVTMKSNYGETTETGYCSGINLQSITPSNQCSNNVVSQLYLEPSGILVAIITCNGAISPTVFQYTVNCRNSFGQFLSAPTPDSKIPSTLWNEIRQDLAYAYNIFKALNQLTKNLNIINDIYSTSFIYLAGNYISSFCETLYNPSFYNLIPISQAYTGELLYASDFNTLVKFLRQVSKIANINLPYKVNVVLPNQVVDYQSFFNIVQNINYLVSFANNNLFKYSNLGYNAENIGPGETILNLVISFLSLNLNIYKNSYIKNFVIMNTNLYLNPSITLHRNVSIKNLYLNGLSNAPNAGTITLQLNNNAYIENALIGNTQLQLNLNGNAVIQNLYLTDVSATINLQPQAIIQNLYCSNSSVTINLYSQYQIFNNQCPNANIFLVSQIFNNQRPNANIFLVS